MDKAKKMAEQAQAKLDEAQKQFNSGPSAPSGPAVEYDKHGRPIAQDPATSVAPPHGDPLAGQAPPPPVSAPPVPPTPGVPPTGQGDPVAGSVPPPPFAPPVAQPGVPPTAPPAAPPAPAAAAPDAPAPPAASPAEDRNHPSYAPPKLSSGDPLAG